MSKNKSDASEETFQEGTTPVQAFSTPVLPTGPGTEIRLRQGRPREAVHESAEVAGAAQAGT